MTEGGGKIPAKDREGAVLLRTGADGYGYALYRPAIGRSFTGQFAVITKAGKGKRRRIAYTGSEEKARRMVEQFTFTDYDSPKEARARAQRRLDRLPAPDAG